MANVKVDFEIDYINDDCIIFELEAEVTTVDNGIGSYEWWGNRENHTQIEAEVSDSVPYVDCVVSEHTEIELQVIKKWILENDEIITEKLLRFYNPKDDEPDYDDY